MSRKPIEWPEGKRFAFTVMDDTDSARLENVSELYAFLADVGLRTTKTAWPFEAEIRSTLEGDSLARPDYRDWLLDLRDRGFEIGWHGATSHTSPREVTLKGLERFREVFGDYPVTMANHAGNEENIYWGDARVTGLRRLAYNALTRFRNKDRFRGHVEGELFWGDACRKHLRYARNFDFSDMNTLKRCPQMPYHDPAFPYVNYWYASCDGHARDAYVKRIAEEHQDRLEEEGGACIMYTHFAKGFHDGKQLDPVFRRLTERLAGKDGWFVPVGTLLDYLMEKKGRHVLTDAERRSLEWRWLRYKLVTGTS
jgi:hypothetical protein